MEAVRAVETDGAIAVPHAPPGVACRQEQCIHVLSGTPVRLDDAREIVQAPRRGPHHEQRRACTGSPDFFREAGRVIAE
jgi:hypothetical protein